jgi:hypothetical protein
MAGRLPPLRRGNHHPAPPPPALPVDAIKKIVGGALMLVGAVFALMGMGNGWGSVTRWAWDNALSLIMISWISFAVGTFIGCVATIKCCCLGVWCGGPIGVAMMPGAPLVIAYSIPLLPGIAIGGLGFWIFNS